MKKQYNLSHLTDELSKSVFFQKPDTAPKQQETKAEKHQSAVALSNQSTKERSNQHAQDTKHEDTKEPSKQSATSPSNQSTVALKHFSSYLQPRTYKAWKLIATGREKKDYEILQEAVEQYLEREQEREANT
jgi:hypothetical protein